MNDSDIESLIRSISEIESLEQHSTPVLHDPACLGMSRLESLAGGSNSSSASERSHLDGCRGCSRTLDVFRDRERDSAAGLPVVWRRWGLCASALATAACLLLLATLRPVPPSVAVDGMISVSIEHTAVAALNDDGCIARFRNTVRENCVVLAVFRAWDSACQCRQWRLYDWGTGDSVAMATVGQPLDISIDVTDMPVVEQLLVVALARRPDDLPDDAAESQALLACLNSSPLETETPEDITGFAAAVKSCLPPGVTVVSHAFSSE